MPSCEYESRVDSQVGVDVEDRIRARRSVILEEPSHTGTGECVATIQVNKTQSSRSRNIIYYLYKMLVVE